MTQLEIEINKLVYEKYPKTKKEFTCWQEKMRLANLRQEFRKRLYDEARETEIQRSVQQDTKEV
jgi:hypothetical protein